MSVLFNEDPFEFPDKCLGFRLEMVDEFTKIVIKNLSKNFQHSIKKKTTLYTRKQPLMIAYEGSESARDNFCKLIYQFQPETETLIRKLERILIKLYTLNVSLLFNETCLNEPLLPNYTHMLNIYDL